jgi:hypothetical protein
LPRPDCDMVVLPDAPGTLVFSRFGGGTPSPAGVWIYDDGRPRPLSVAGGYGGFTSIALGLAPNTLIGRDDWTGRFRTIQITGDGLIAQPAPGDEATFYGDFSVGGTNILGGNQLLASIDSDGDGIPDEWEIEHGLDPHAQDAEADPDMDGASNLTEYFAGTAPQSSASVPDITAILISNRLRLLFPTAGGRHFHVERSSDPLNGPWTTIFDSVSSGGMQVYDVAYIGADHGYFRIRITP